ECTSSPSVIGCASAAGRTKVTASFTGKSASVALLRYGEVASDAPAARVHAGRSAVDHSAAGVEIDHQPLPVDDVRPAGQLDVADDRDQFLVEIVDPEIALRGFGWAVHDDTARGIEPADLHPATTLLHIRTFGLRRARISNRQSLRIERQ